MAKSKESIGEIEAILLSKLVRYVDRLDDLEYLEDAHFSSDLHRHLFVVLQEMRASGNFVDQHTVEARLSAKFRGQFAYQDVPQSGLAAYERLVYDDYVHREGIRLARKLDAELSGGMRPETALDRHSSALYALRTENFSARVALSQREAIEELHREQEAARHRTTLMETGVVGLDKLLESIRPSAFVTVAGDTGIGKSTLALQMVAAAAAAGRRCLVLNLEMSVAEIEASILAMMSSLDAADILHASVPEHLSETYVEFEATLSDYPIDVKSVGSITAQQVRSLVERVTNPRYEVVVVDHVQLLSPPPGKATAFKSRHTLLDDDIALLRRMSLDLNVTVILLSQLSRDAAKARRAPVVSDLRESSAIEAASSNILMMHRPYDIDDRYKQFPDHNLIKVQAKKVRLGREARTCYLEMVAGPRFVEAPAGHVLPDSTKDEDLMLQTREAMGLPSPVQPGPKALLAIAKHAIGHYKEKAAHAGTCPSCQKSVWITAYPATPEGATNRPPSGLLLFAHCFHCQVRLRCGLQAGSTIRVVSTEHKLALFKGCDVQGYESYYAEKIKKLHEGGG